MARGRKRKFKKQDILNAIKGSYGIITNVAENLGCEWHTAADYVKLWPETTEALNDENERYLDLAEKKCIERIQAADGQMIRFVLATRGKKRGYTSEENTPAGDNGAEDTTLIINAGDDVEAKTE